MKKHLAKNLVVTATLAATAVLLVADSTRECSHPNQAVSFAMAGDCGPASTVLVRSAEESCELDVENAEAANLPDSGQFTRHNFDLKQGDWELLDGRMLTVPDGNGGASQVSGTRECQATLEEGTLKLRCQDTRLDVAPNQQVAACEAVLTAR
ncbi:MAG: hypothetical protein JXB05_16385 [Myxococcaceae bacterium]|nr:hypothetical protein [Myxococcaceae bacterium]